MSDHVTYSECGQNALVLAIYSLAPRFVRGKVANQDVQDVVHDITLDCLFKLREGSWGHQLENLQAFVRKLVANHLSNRRRRHDRSREQDGEHYRARAANPPAWVSPDRSTDEDVVIAHQRKVLYKLPWRCRNAYYLVREEGVSYKEAAGLLGVSPKTVQDYIVRAQYTLREEL